MPPPVKSSGDKLFIEWSHKVLEELSTLNARMESLDDKYNLLRSGAEDRFAHVDKKIEKINERIGELLMDHEKGLLIRVDRLEQQNIKDFAVRLDRLEQAESRQTWLLRACVVACLGAIGATIASYFKGGVK